MGIGTSLKKLAGSGALGLVGKTIYKKDGSTRGSVKKAGQTLSPAYAAMSKDEETEGAVGPTGRPQSRQGTMSKFFNRPEVKDAAKSAAKSTVMGMKSGGSVSSRADGIAKKGKTKGRMV